MSECLELELNTYYRKIEVESSVKIENFGYKTNVAVIRAGGIKGRRELGSAKNGPIRYLYNTLLEINFGGDKCRNCGTFCQIAPKIISGLCHYVGSTS